MAGLLDYLYDPSSVVYSGQGGLLTGLTPNTGIIPQSSGFPQTAQAATFNDRWNSLSGGGGRSFDAATFDPSTYAPSPNNPIAVGNYQMPRMGNPDQYQPQQVATPPNAMPTQGQVPMQQSPGLGDRLMAGLQNFADASAPIPAIAGAISGLATGNVTANKTAKFLESRGLDPSLAKTVVSDSQLLRAVLPQMIGVGGQTDDIKEYQFAKREDPSLTFQKFMQQKKAVSGEFGMQPIWGTGPDGKPAVIQLGKSGEAKQSVLPPGFSLARDPIKIDGPTGTTILDPQTRQQVGFIPKDRAAAEAADIRGKAQGTAQAALANGADLDAEETKKKIDDLLDESRKDGLASIVGPLDQFRGSWTLGQTGRDALARLEQLQGGAFLQAYSTLKGGGAITEMEGQKAEKAIARMQRSQSEDDFRQALKDFRDAIDLGLQKLRRAAAGGEVPQPATPTPASSDLKKKYGLD